MSNDLIVEDSMPQTPQEQGNKESLAAKGAEGHTFQMRTPENVFMIYRQ